MADVYHRLARKLDRLPHGYPATESGVEIRILRKLFTPDDARAALDLGLIPVPVERMARRMGVPVEAARVTLDRMAARGLIGSYASDGIQHYALAPFVIGIFEFQVAHIDAEFARLYEEYAPHLLKTLGGHAPALGRVVPVQRALAPGLEVLPYDDLRALISAGQSFALRECVCRKERALQGHPCTHSLETCLGVSPEPHAYDYFNYAGRVISQDEAFSVLETTEDEVLVHVTYNVRRSSMFVCNCCSCCCGFMRAVNDFQAPHALAASSVVAAIDAGVCASCGHCESPRCPTDAIRPSADRLHLEVVAERCIGCGVCVSGCPYGAARLVSRPAHERPVPADSIATWTVERLAQRHPLGRLALRAWPMRRSAAADAP